jgi:hypothetical protein
MIRNAMDKNRGFVLIVALGVLGVLGLLAATFATLSHVEKSVSSSYVDKVRAKMLAQSGIERAIAAIRGRCLVQSWDDPRNDWYYREMLNAPVGSLSYPSTTSMALDHWAPYVPARPYGRPARSLEASLEDGLNGTGINGISLPALTAALTKDVISGEFPGTYQLRGDVYALKILDCTSMINVNDGSGQIQRILNNLGSILLCEDGTPVSAGGFQLGTAIAAKSATRLKPFNNKSEILDEVFIQNALFAGMPTEARKRFNAVKDYITCHGWMDGTTVRFQNTWQPATDYIGGSYAAAMASNDGAPMGPAAPDGGLKEALASGSPSVESVSANLAPTSVPASPLYTLRAQVPGGYAALPGTSILAAPGPITVTDSKRGGGFKQFVMNKGQDLAYGGENPAEYISTTYYFMEPRCPINVNTVSREVLVATLKDLEADLWDYEVYAEGVSPLEYTARLALKNIKINQAEAEAAADWIISGRYTFPTGPGLTPGSWSYNDWMHFEDEVIQTIPGLTRYQKALIKANANPNSNIRKLCPDLIMVCSNPGVNPDELVHLDKSDIKVPSTDWCFTSNGFFEIECIGRVYDKGAIMAEEKIETVVKVFDLVRYSNQKQFEEDRIWTTENSNEGDLMANGYPPVVSMPEYAYNPVGNPTRYKSGTGATSWCADFEGYLVLNGPAKISVGQTPSNTIPPGTGGSPWGYSENPYDACWGPAVHDYSDGIPGKPRSIRYTNSGSATALKTDWAAPNTGTSRTSGDANTFKPFGLLARAAGGARGPKGTGIGPYVDPINDPVWDDALYPANSTPGWGTASSSPRYCGVSFVAGFNLASLYPNVSHKNWYHDPVQGGTATPRHPEYSYTSPHCFADGGSMSANPLYSRGMAGVDTVEIANYKSGGSWSGTKATCVEPAGAEALAFSWGGSPGIGANFWDNGCDLTNFGIYVNQTRRNRFMSFWADEVPAPDVTVEMHVKPEIDLWNWATRSKKHVASGWGSSYSIWPCSRQFLFEWGTGGTHGMNYTVRCYVQLQRVYLEFFFHLGNAPNSGATGSAAVGELFVMSMNHAWKPHTWHHVECSWVKDERKQVVLSDGSTVVVDIPPNAMLFVDGVPPTDTASIVDYDETVVDYRGAAIGSGALGRNSDVNTYLMNKDALPLPIFPHIAMVLPFAAHPTIPNNNVGEGPRFDIGSMLANDGSYGMSSPRWHGIIDNVVMHHWRAHDKAFTPRNRYHSTSYFDGATNQSAVGYGGEKAGVYKKRLTFLESECNSRDTTLGTIQLTHYHPWHQHLYGHDGSMPISSFGHITPAMRMKSSGGSYVDAYYYDGGVGVPIKSKIATGTELYYLAWFEVASAVPVTMSPILCDMTVTYFAEPVTYYRLASSEAKK